MVHQLKHQYERPSDSHSVFGACIRLLFTFSALAAILLCATSAWAQGQTIEGKITDVDTKETMPGVTVSIPALKIGAKTNSMGEYKIKNAPPGKHVVEARLIGYATQTQPVELEAGGTATANFTLSAKALQQNEVVVMGLSGEVDRKKLGNAIAEVSGDQISGAVTPSAIDALSGRVPGLIVSKPSGTPGAGTYITIRGRKTISGSSEPLYVVDGVVIDNSSIQDQHYQGGAIQLANRAVDISSENVENVEILKGPAASALYGSLAANGVVLITTKRAHAISGEGGKTSSLTFSTSVDRNENAGRPGTEIIQSKYGQKGKTSSSYGNLLPADTTKYNHVEELLLPSYSNEQTLSFSGGIPDFSYFASGVRSDLAGLIDNSTYEKNDIRVNLQLVPFPELSVKSNSNFISINNNLPQDGSNRSGLILGTLRTPPEFANNIIYNPDGTQHRYAGYDNPMWSIQNNHFNSSIERFLHSTEASLTPVSWLTLTGRIGLDKYNQLNEERLAVGSRSSDNSQGLIGQDRYQTSSVNADFNGTISFIPVEDLSTQLVLGSQVIWANSSATGANSKTTLPFFDQISAGATKDATSRLGASKLVGFFGQLTNTFYDRYTLTLAIRRDGSSTFGNSAQFHWYPKASFALQLPIEDWGITPDIISSLKLRGGYGEAGSPSLPGAYATNFLYTVYGNNDGWERTTSAGRNGQIGIRQGSGDYNSLFVAGNTSISPEISIERELGIDIALWNNKINFEASYYHTNVNDLILNIPVPGSSGYDKQLRNAGAFWNEGFEFGLTVLPINTPDFNWRSIVTYSRNYSLVTNLSGVNYVDIYGFIGIQNVAIVGRPLGVFQGAGYKRDANGNILLTTGAADDYFGNDYKGAPQLTDSLQVVGDPNPSFAVGWRNEFTIIHDLTFSFLFDGVFGQDVWNGTKGALYNFGAAKATEDREDPWVFNGQTVIDNATGKPVTKEQYYRQYANSFATGIEEPVIEKGSYIKLRELSLSYNWGGLKDWKIDRVKFTLTARNLFTISKYSGFDPEVNTFAQSEARGFDYFNLPPMRTYHFSVSLTY